MKPVGAISGGEAQRLSLAILVDSGANLLILDEPTNHLDVESREALEDALQRFEGTLLLISHDRALLEAVGSRTVVLSDSRLHSHPGGWAEYRAAVHDQQQADRPQAGERDTRSKAKGPSKNRVALIARLERETEEAERRLSKLEDELGDPSRWADSKRSAELDPRARAGEAGGGRRLCGLGGRCGGRRLGPTPPRSDYSERPAASRASAGSRYSRIRITLPSSKSASQAMGDSVSMPLSLPRPCRWPIVRTRSPRSRNSIGSARSSLKASSSSRERRDLQARD